MAKTRKQNEQDFWDYKKLKELDKKNNEQEIIEVHGGKVKIDKIFRPTKVKLMVAEFASIIDDLVENGMASVNINKTLIGVCLILRHFTSLDVPSEYEDMIEYYGVLEDNSFIAPIMNRFDDEEVNKVNMMIGQLTQALQDRNGELENSQDVNIDIELEKDDFNA